MFELACKWGVAFLGVDDGTFLLSGTNGLGKSRDDSNEIPL